MSPKYRDMDGFSFDDENKDWLDNPPEDWSPPKNATLVWSHVHDSRVLNMPDGTIYQKTDRELIDEGGFYVIRIDAWGGKGGIHMHFRTLQVSFVPHPESESGLRAYSNKTVTGFVLPWDVYGALQEHNIDPGLPTKPNGKGYEKE